MINKYLDRLEALIVLYRELDLEQFEGPGGKKADFDDSIWYHIDPNTGRSNRLLCGIHGKKGRGNAGGLPTDALPHPYNYLVKVWIIETTNTNLSASEKRARTSAARKLLSFMDGDLYIQSESTVRSLNLGRRVAGRLRSFFEFCADKGVMRKIDLKGVESRDRSGHASFDKKLDKLPDMSAVIALGNIFTTVFEHVDESGSLRPGMEIKINDALVVTSTLLSLASPNRASAEIPLLPKQKLQSHSEGKGELVYYLDWIGSKGYKNNKNHVLSALAQPINKAVNFFYNTCEPARILCRFYEKPNRGWKALLGKFEIEPELKKNVSLSQRPNLFTLGYALGFYGVDDNVPVLKKGADLTCVYTSHRGRFFENKSIFSLRSDDQVSVSASKNAMLSGLPSLFGYTQLPKLFAGKDVVTIGEVQDWWVSFYRKTILPEFPFSFSNGESCIKLKNALFCFLGSWFHGDAQNWGGGGKILKKTNYAMVPLASLGSSILSRLCPPKNRDSIFFDYGYSSELSLTPNKLRHLTNTLADLSDIPIEIITAWSGRKSAEQTHTYIHTSDEIKASRVSAIVNPPEIDQSSIRTFSKEQIKSATNLPASLTSTGLCAQNLHVNPCNYLNDFISQCFMCPETCYIAGDESAIDFLEKDLAFQTVRLESVAGDIRLSTSTAMKKWYVIHSRNTYILSLLISLMKDSPLGTTIRYSNKSSQFHLVDLQTMVITKVACALPDFETRLRDVIESGVASVSAHVNPDLCSLLSSFGLSDKEF
ncbi:hypothetical protein PMI29_05755 [Pseudomonas sp. GM49]|uniref:hypothetical protein n=1 Tax=Pseudomonas sp. GM49 TaxID=1144331 RepID=UPI0002701FBB|nr:hypothetical protein [Pseudomonas sp. GM49]EJM53567.1 hypothetical protein PMI29_05755 [Pseudomonas sp. GM49]